MSASLAGPVLLAAAGTAAAAAAIWVARAWLLERRPGRVPCLLYHQIHRDDAPAALADPVYACFAGRFAEQMEALRAGGWTTLTLDALMKARRDPGLLPPKPVIVTFDDGFGSNYELAFPVLRARGQSATIFATPDRSCGNFRRYANVDRPLRDEEMAELAAGGVAIQSHGLTHRFLTTLDDDDLRHEMVASRAVLERVTGTPVRYLAIPGGAYDRRVRRAAIDAGYQAVFCMRKGSIGLRDDPYALPRMVVARDMSLEDFRRLLTPAAWFQGRLVSSLQDAAARLFGMAAVDAVRRVLYRSPAARLLRPRTLAWTVLGVVAGGCAALLVIAALLS